MRNREAARWRTAAWTAANPDEARARWRKGYRRNAERIRREKLAQHYRRRYGITLEQRDAMLAAQGGGCAICGKPPVPGKRGFHVDHCHQTGRVRGLLCSNCNTLLGLAGESEAVLRAAINYLQRE